MKKILIIDACMRKEDSRTALLLAKAEETLKGLHPDWTFARVRLADLPIRYLDKASLAERDALLADKRYDHPRFDLAHQFQEADGMIVAAPFWDLSFPAVLKVYIENVSVDGLTFYCDEQGLHGRCKAAWMLHLCTRGGIWDEDTRQDEHYLRAMCGFFGVGQYHVAAAEGIDIVGLDHEKILGEALAQTERICRTLA